jgi:nitrogen permease regulator 2-like protein
MLKSIFYSRFHPERGRSVIHQVPSGSIIPTPGSDNQPLVNISDISAYIIPPYELCDRQLSITSNGYRVLGFPVSLEDPQYERNRFTFNVCFVLDTDEDYRPWTTLVKKIAAFFAELETEDGILQAEENLAGLKWAGEEGYPVQNTGVIYRLLDAIFRDMNAYGETCVRADDFHVLNLRLTTHRQSPPKIKAWDVPLLVRPLPNREQWTWDLALKQIQPYIDGVTHVQRIAQLADVELKLAKRAIRELLYHGRIILMDLFHFQAIYAPTSDMAWFVKDDSMLDECRDYVSIPPKSDQAEPGQSLPAHATITPSKSTIVGLYTSLSPGAAMHDFALSHEAQLSNIDLRRFITFGVIKGFLRRIHKYALAIDSPSSNHLGTTDSSPSKSKPKSNEDAVREFDRAWKKAALTSGWATPPTEPPPIATELSKSSRSHEELRTVEDEMLRSYLDGKHCMDEICVEMRMSEKKVVERIRSGRFGEVVLFNK